MLFNVPDWRGLAGSLNTKVNDIEEDCKQDVTPARCYRRSLVRRYCNMQRSKNPSKVAKDIAKALEQMDHKLQAEQLRKLQFGKSMVNHYNSLIIEMKYYNIAISIVRALAGARNRDREGVYECMREGEKVHESWECNIGERVEAIHLYMMPLQMEKGRGIRINRPVEEKLH